MKTNLILTLSTLMLMTSSCYYGRDYILIQPIEVKKTPKGMYLKPVGKSYKMPLDSICNGQKVLLVNQRGPGLRGSLMH